MDYFIFLQIGLFILVFGAALAVNQSRNKKTAALFDALAMKHNGTLLKGNLLSVPRLKLDDEGTEILIFSTPGGRNSPPHTWFQARLSLTRDFKINLYREYNFYKVGKMFGMQDVVLDNPEFDESFIVQGSDELIVRSFFSGDIQAKLLPWKERSAALRIENKQLQFSVPSRFQSEQEYDALIETGRALLRQARELG